MGFRRWIIYLLIVTLPVIALFGGLRLTHGPYTLACAPRHDGLAIIVTSLSSGKRDAYSIPFGACP